MFDRGHIIQQNHAIGCRAQDRVLDLVELFETCVRNNEVKFVVLFKPPDCDQNVRG